ncbi:MAG: DUF6505 family protein [Dongiaceae bacterium]
MKFLRIIYPADFTCDQFDPPAVEGEWAVSGTFTFDEVDSSNEPEGEIDNAWLGTDSFGGAQFAVVSEMSEKDYNILLNRLSHQLVERGFCNDKEKSVTRATEELQHTILLIQKHPIGNILSLEREISPNGVIERYHIARRAG